jgi:nicotinamidase-related amidase
MIDLSAFHLEPKTSLVLVVGMQNEYCSPGGALYSAQYRQCVAPVADLIGAAGEYRIPVICVQSVRTGSEASVSVWNRSPILREGTWNSRLIQELPPAGANTSVVESHSHDPFFHTGLDRLLAELVPEPTRHCAVVVGLRSNVEALYAMYGFHLRDFWTIGVVDCLAGSEGCHEDTLKLLNRWNFWNVFLSRSDLLDFGDAGEGSGRVVVDAGPGRTLRPAEP